VFVSGAVGGGDGEPSVVWSEVVVPSAFVGLVVVTVAERQKVGEVGGAVLAGPVGDVVDVAVVEQGAAARNRAAGVHDAQCASLVCAGEALGPAEVLDGAVAVEHGGDDVGRACDTADGLDRELDTAGDVGSGVLVDAVEEGVEIDHDDELWAALVV
jgi:hypothetical protein